MWHGYRALAAANDSCTEYGRHRPRRCGRSIGYGRAGCLEGDARERRPRSLQPLLFFTRISQKPPDSSQLGMERLGFKINRKVSGMFLNPIPRFPASGFE